MKAAIHDTQQSEKTSNSSFFQTKNKQSRFFTPFIQTKLTVNEPGDSYEQEADAVADKVMRMPTPSPRNRDASTVNSGQMQLKPMSFSQIQRKCADCEEKEKLQRKENGSGGGQAAPSIVSDVLASSGQPLDGNTRQFMESRMGHDFSNVQIHTDNKAAESAAAVKAWAYTSGNHVVFNRGQYAPDTEGGKRLLAHELVHTVQQRAKSMPIQRLIRTPYPWRGVIIPTIGVHIRSTANSTNPSNILGSIPHGQSVNVISSSGDWLQVESKYTGSLITGYIYHPLVDDATSTAMDRSVGQTMVWRPSGPSSGTDFQLWASATSEQPFVVTSTTVMNCWEAVLLSAYRSGSLSWGWIHNLYTSVPSSNWVNAMSRGVRRTYSVPGPNLNMPQRGDIVFFDGLAHIALATGNGSEVFTFWPPPNTPFARGGTTDKVKKFTIEQLVNWWGTNMPPQPVVEFSAPVW